MQRAKMEIECDTNIWREIPALTSDQQTKTSEICQISEVCFSRAIDLSIIHQYYEADQPLYLIITQKFYKILSFSIAWWFRYAPRYRSRHSTTGVHRILITDNCPLFLPHHQLNPLPGLQILFFGQNRLQLIHLIAHGGSLLEFQVLG